LQHSLPKRECQGLLSNPSGIAHGHHRLVSAFVKGWRGTARPETSDTVGVFFSAVKAHGITKLCPLDIVFFSALAAVDNVLAHSSFSLKAKQQDKKHIHHGR
jgi:hypothetical protein